MSLFTEVNVASVTVAGHHDCPTVMFVGSIRRISGSSRGGCEGHDTGSARAREKRRCYSVVYSCSRFSEVGSSCFGGELRGGRACQCRFIYSG